MRRAASRTIHGVDFSGGRDAPTKIRLASGRLVDGRLVIEACRSAGEAFGVGSRDAALDALRAWIAERERAVIGLDCSLGLPASVIETDDWEAALDEFDFPDVATMQTTYTERARDLTDGERAHLKRATDETHGASSPYGFITRSQTYYGLSRVVKPLVAAGQISVLPMQSPDPDRPWLLEAYPAATLDRLGLHRTGYSDRSDGARERRAANLTGLEAWVEVPESARERALDSDDALDALVAAFAAAEAVREGPPARDPASHPEGRIFV